jgi:hypothetical protein
MLTLIISHHIHLEKPERYKLAEGNEISVVGVSVPVWFFKGNTSEPAAEIFCKYLLTNKPNEFPICMYEQGYRVNLQQVPSSLELRKKPKNWDEFNQQQRIDWYKKYNFPISGNDLLDLKDGGLEFLQYNHYHKVVGFGGGINVTHMIHINKQETLVNSLG